MRRGRLIGFLAMVLLLAAVAGWGGAAVARADGTPQGICADLQDGKVDGSYTAAEWQAFLDDPTVQGYCSVVVPPCVVPTLPGCATPPCTEATGGTGTGTGGTGGTACSTTTTPVALTPTPVAVVAGATHKPTSGVLGKTHTQSAPKQAVAPVHVAQAGGTLPFTGLQLGLFVAVGLLLVGVGFTLRRAGRASSRD
jgi:hypothetical protein